MSKLAKYRSKIKNKFGDEFLKMYDKETDYRILKRVYVLGGGDDKSKLLKELYDIVIKKKNAGKANEEIKNFISANKVKLNMNRSDYNRLLHLFCENVYFFEGDSIYFLDKNLAYVNAVEEKKTTPLHIAAGAKNTNLFMYLVKKGGDLSLENESKETPLIKALGGYNFPDDCKFFNSLQITDEMIKKDTNLLNYIIKCDKHQVQDEKMKSIIANTDKKNYDPGLLLNKIKEKSLSLAKVVCFYLNILTMMMEDKSFFAEHHALIKKTFDEISKNVQQECIMQAKNQYDEHCGAVDGCEKIKKSMFGNIIKMVKTK